MERASHPAYAAPFDFAWRTAPVREYVEVFVVIGVVTAIAWFVPLDYRVFGDAYLLAVIALCLRVGRWPILFASIISVVAWKLVIVPPRMSFSRLELRDGVFLGTYFVAALLAGQLTARIRAQERRERHREQRATALFHLTRALSSAQTLDEAVTAALRQADELFGAETALLLVHHDQTINPHPAGSLRLDPGALARAEQILHDATAGNASRGGTLAGSTLHFPLTRQAAVLGLFSVGNWSSPTPLSADQRELIEAFATQISLLVEREKLRAASEREKLLAESDRLYRTLLDSVSHELKTPVAVLRSAGDNIATVDGPRRLALAHEIRTATVRLERLIGNLLSQTRITAGGVKAQMDWCDARDVVGAARRAVGDVLASRPLAIAIPADMPLFMADFLLMEQVVANLLLNAVLHTPEATPIKISAGIASDGGVFLTIADEGPGISRDLQSKLFQKFQRGPQARPGGLGLGLSIVRGFMLAQGGQVSVQSGPAHGARFTLHLPHRVHSTVPLE